MRGPGPRMQASWPPVLLGERKTRLRPLHPCRQQVPGACTCCAAKPCSRATPLCPDKGCISRPAHTPVETLLANRPEATRVCAWSSRGNHSVPLGCAAAVAHPRPHDAQEQAAAAGTFGVTPASAPLLG